MFSTQNNMELLIKKNFFRYFIDIVENDYLNKKYKEMKTPFIYDDEGYHKPKEFYPDEFTTVRYDVNKEMIITSRYDHASKETISKEESFENIIRKEIGYRKSELEKNLKIVLNKCRTIESLKYQIKVAEGIISELLLKLKEGKFSGMVKKLIPDVESSLESINQVLAIEQAVYEVSMSPKKGEQPKDKSRDSIKAIMYSTNPGKLKTLFKDLRRAGLILSPEHSEKDFLKLFAGNTIEAGFTKIVWKDQRSLKYFIDSLAEIGEGKLFKLPDHQWIFANQFFRLEDTPESDDAFKFIKNETKTHLLSKKVRLSINDILSKLET